MQSLWKEVGGQEAHGHSFKEYNGIVEALATLCGAGAAALVSFLKVNWSVWGELTIGALSLLDSALLLFASAATTLWEVYLSHILYRATYTFLITVARLASVSGLPLPTPLIMQEGTRMKRERGEETWDRGYCKVALTIILCTK